MTRHQTVCRRTVFLTEDLNGGLSGVRVRSVVAGLQDYPRFEETRHRKMDNVESTVAQAAISTVGLTAGEPADAVWDGGPGTCGSDREEDARSPGGEPLPRLDAATDDPSEPSSSIEASDGDDGSASQFEQEIGEDRPGSDIVLAGPAELVTDGDPREVRLRELAREIAVEWENFTIAAHSGFKAKLRLGQYLTEARKLCPPRGWIRYVECLGLSLRTVQECMQFAEHRTLFEGEAHGRARWTTESARKLIAERRRAEGPGKPARSNTEKEARPSARPRHRDDADDRGRPGPPDDDAAVAMRCEPVSPSTDAPDDGSTGPSTEATRPEPATVVHGVEDTAGAGATPASTPTTAADAEGPEPDPGQPGDRVEPGPSDKDWLDAIPLRRELDDPSHFDREAILWRRTRPLAARASELIAPTPEEIARSTYFMMTRNQFRLRLLFALRVNDPALWRLCSQCRGRSTDRPGTIPCSRCDGHGYVLSHEGEVVEEEDVLE
jgi:hypothetical protein